MVIEYPTPRAPVNANKKKLNGDRIIYPVGINAIKRNRKKACLGWVKNCFILILRLAVLSIPLESYINTTPHKAPVIKTKILGKEKFWLIKLPEIKREITAKKKSVNLFKFKEVGLSNLINC